MPLFVLVVFACNGSGSLAVPGTDAPTAPAPTAPPAPVPTTPPEPTDPTPTEPTEPHEIDWSLCHVELDCEFDVLWDEPKQNCDALFTEGNGYLLYDGIVGVERRGRSSLDWAKSNLSLEFWAGPTTHLVPPFSDWRIHEGSPVDPAWKTTAFDDGAWAVGTAPLGWDEDPNPQLNTQLTAQAAITAWFRHTFPVADPALLDPVRMWIRADDGAVVYLNGIELHRENMAIGVPTAQTPALSFRGGQEEVTWGQALVPDGLLVAGDNVVAVELHQGGPDSVDAIFDLTLATKPPTESPDFYEMGGASDWILGGAYVDLSQFRNVLLYDLFIDFDPDGFAPETHFCEVTHNNDWIGLYQLTEKIERNDDRLDLVEDGLGGSFIVKNDDSQLFYETDFVYGGWQLVYPSEALRTPASDLAVLTWLEDWETAARGGGNVWDYIDMDAAVDWVLLQELGKNGDAYALSIHVVKNDGELARFVPWDFDLTLGLSCGGTTGWNWQGLAPDMVGAMANDPAFQQALTARWAELRQNTLRNDQVGARIDAFDPLFGTTVDDNFVRWPEEDIIGGDDWVLAFLEGCPTYVWEDSRDAAASWLLDRMNWLDDHIDEFPN